MIFFANLILIRHCIKLAINEWGLMLASNPVDKVKLPSSLRSRERRLNTGEFDRLEKAACLTQNPHIWPIVVFAIETGMRKSEILSITNDDVKDNHIFLAETKNGNSRKIPLTSKVREIINKSKLPYSISSNAVRLSWSRMIKKAGIVDLHFHDLRHEAISRFFEKGLSIPEVSLISGHKDVRQLMRYTHLKINNLINKLN